MRKRGDISARSSAADDSEIYRCGEPSKSGQRGFSRDQSFRHARPLCRASRELPNPAPSFTRRASRFAEPAAKQSPAKQNETLDTKSRGFCSGNGAQSSTRNEGPVPKGPRSPRFKCNVPLDWPLIRLARAQGVPRSNSSPPGHFRMGLFNQCTLIRLPVQLSTIK